MRALPIDDGPTAAVLRVLIPVVLALVVVWYAAAVAMNWSLVRDGFEREETVYTVVDLIEGTLNAERPLVAAPHQVVAQFVDSVFGYPPDSPLRAASEQYLARSTEIAVRLSRNF